LESMMEKKKNWIGHAVREERLLKEVLEGRMEGKRTRRRRMGMIDDLLEGTYVEINTREEKTERICKVWMVRTCQSALIHHVKFNPNC